MTAKSFKKLFATTESHYKYKIRDSESAQLVLRIAELWMY